MTDDLIDVDVLCVGHACQDLVFSVPATPTADSKTIADGLVSCGGGPAANAAITVARLGYAAAFAGYLGNDAFGDLHLRELEQEGVAADLVVRGDHPTPLSVVLVQPDGNRLLVNYRGDTPPLPAGSVDFSALATRVILLDGHQPEISTLLARAAHEHGMLTILDAGSVHPGSEALMGLVDYLVCSEGFARQLTRGADEGRALGELYRHAPNVVITLGARGLVWMNREGSGLLPAHEVDVVDTTGAGDAFHGALAACLAGGRGWDDSLVFSSAVAALCCTRLGARTAIPTGDEVDRFLAK